MSVTLTTTEETVNLTTTSTPAELSVTSADVSLTVSPSQAIWGGVTGTLSSQTDLEAALDDKLSLTGGTMTGALTLAADPTTALEPATKEYTDAADALRLTKANNLSDVESAATALANLGGVPLAGGTMSGALYGYLILNTRANILASTPAATTIAYATDTSTWYLWDGAHWQVAALPTAIDTSTPDMGYTQASTKLGYYSDVITDKTLENITLGGGGASNSGAVRVTTGGQFQVYLNGTWQQVVVNFRFLEDPLNQRELEHEPEGYTTWVAVMSGNSLNNLGLDGYPLLQQYTSSIGCYPGVFVALDGGVF